jgi:ABC-type glycerol-3-phosphate transport system substrate-binding protein
MKLIKIFIIILIFSLLLFGFEVKSQLVPMPTPQKTKKPLLSPVNLEWWVIWDDPSDLSPLISNFSNLYPHVNINVRKLRYSEYKEALINAWARDVGPDIFSIPNTWIKEYKDFIEPMPDKVSLKKEIESGPGCFKKRKIVTKEEKLLTLKDIKEKFVPQVEKDVVIEGKIYALPLSFDTLVLYYNRDLLDSAKIPLPPKNWQEFTDQVKKLTLVDKEGNIYQAGAALGTSNNIERPADILSLLMMQVGARMRDEAGFATFNQPLPSDPNYFPAEEALRFYTDFQDKNKEIYTWNKEMPNALEFFIQGKLAFFFGYSYHLPLIRARAPQLNLGITKMPQPEGAIKEINFAHYQVQVVSKKSKNKEWAWAFLTNSALSPQGYLAKTRKPTALRSLIPLQIQDPDLEVFLSQALTASSWYSGKNALLMEEAFKEMIDNVIEGKKTYLEAINLAVLKINQTIK